MSVVVTITEGGDALATCLSALTAQDGAPELEIIVPYDDSVAGMESIVRQFESVRFLDLGHVPTRRSRDNAAGQHELVDLRRAAGLGEAEGDLIGMIEDRGAPRPNWAATAVRLMRESTHAVIGGAVVAADADNRGWALDICDFGRYQLPLEGGPSTYVSDVNLVYRRSALMEVRQVWLERYHETSVHWAIAQNGGTLFLSPELVVDHRRGRPPWSEMLPERFHWSRLFAYTRAQESGLPRRLAFAAGTVLLPLLLLTRIGRGLFGKPGFGRFLATAPLFALLLTAKAAGEAAGYLTAKP